MSKILCQTPFKVICLIFVRLIEIKQSHCSFAVIRNGFTCQFMHTKHPPPPPLKKKINTGHNVLANEMLESPDIKRVFSLLFAIHDGHCARQHLCGTNLEELQKTVLAMSNHRQLRDEYFASSSFLLQLRNEYFASSSFLQYVRIKYFALSLFL